MLPTIPRHELAALHTRAIIATAHWADKRHDLHACPTPHNDSTALRDRTVLASPGELSLPGEAVFISSHGCNNVL